MASSGSMCRQSAASTARAAASKSMWAPPSGSGMTSSTTPMASRSREVIWSCSAASTLRELSRKTIEAAASGEATE